MYRIKKLIRLLLEKIGFVKPKNPFENKAGWPGLRVLPKVDNLIDVGIGHQGSEGLYKFFTNSRKFFIDPVIETKAAVSKHLEDTNNKFFECGVSSKQGELEIIIRNPISQSGFNESKNDSSKFVEKRKVKVDTLDNLFPAQSLAGSWGIKIDVEGHEFEVLIGGKELIKNCLFVILEVSIKRDRYNNSPDFKDIVNWMWNLNFEFAAIRVSGDGTDHFDVAFVKKNI